MTDAATPSFLDLSAQGFSTRSNAVAAARAAHWCARTPYGLAVLRHQQVGRLLRDRRLRQGSHGWPRRHGMTGVFTDFWERSVIGREGDHHRCLRRLATDALSRDFVDALKPDFDRIAAEQVGVFDETGRLEFMEAFAIPFAGKAIAVLIGIGAENWREISHDASDLGLAMGVDCKAHQARVDAACQRLTDLAQDLTQRVRSGRDDASYIARLTKGFDANPDTDETALLDMIVISIFGGVDTTRSQLGLGMTLFADHPDQYQAFRADPSLAPHVVEEFIRARPTTTWSSREALEDFTFEGVDIEAGQTIHLFVNASARDPLVCDDPNFDVLATRKAHFGFGGGAHHCLGNQVARSDMASALTALGRRVANLELDGPPEMLPDSGNTSPVRLDLRYELDRPTGRVTNRLSNPPGHLS